MKFEMYGNRFGHFKNGLENIRNPLFRNLQRNKEGAITIQLHYFCTVSSFFDRRKQYGSAKHNCNDFNFFYCYTRLDMSEKWVHEHFQHQVFQMDYYRNAMQIH